jgi:hypothetical protein
MTARLNFSPDAAAPSGKNVPTAPGSTAQSQNRTEEPQMVDTTTPFREDNAVTYTPVELNRLVSREIAGRLREVAGTLATNADVVGDLFTRLVLAGTYIGALAVRAQVYRDVASQLRAVAAFELETAGIACSWCGEAL